MPKDRSWVLLDDHRLEAFQNGCVEFLDFAFAKCAIDNKIRCPCRDCNCRKFGDREFVHKHLLWRGWDKFYGNGRWRMHLESEEEYNGGEMNETSAVEIPEIVTVNEYDRIDANVDDNMGELLHACLHHDQHDPHEEPTQETDDFRNLIQEWCIPLYDGCREYSKLSFIMEFYKIKSRGKMSDMTFTETLQLMRKIHLLNIPESFYEVKKLISKLGCGYVKIDACENDCMLFWKDDLNLNTCKVCNASRWKTSVESQPSSSTTQRKRVPKKVLRHFPLIPRLKRLYICEKTSVNMRWHAESRCNDGVLRHPADSNAWKEFDKTKSSKCKDSRKAIATDHHWGRTSINSWSHKHFKKFGTTPTVVDKYKKAFMGIDSLREMGSSTSEDDIEEPFTGTATPDQLAISAELEKVYEECILGGSDESTANSLAYERVLGKSKGLGIKSASTKSIGKSRFSSSRQEEMEARMEFLQEQLQIRDDKVDKLQEELQTRNGEMEQFKQTMETRDGQMEQLQQTLNTLLESLRQQGIKATMSNDGV